MPRKTNDKKAILIVGDWVIDEYWFLVRHYSDISSHTGFVHYRIASDEREIIRDLCGAGHVVRILYQLFKGTGEQYEIYGLGNWSNNDEELIKHLIHGFDKIKNGDNRCTAVTANFYLTPTFSSTCSEPPNISINSIEPNSNTILVIRQYHQEDDCIEQINRIDWEPKREKQITHNDNILSNVKLPQKHRVKAIVVNDLRKGVVTDKLINTLQ